MMMKPIHGPIDRAFAVSFAGANIKMKSITLVQAQNKKENRYNDSLRWAILGLR